MADYVKNRDLDFVLQLNSFSTTLPTYAATFGLVAAELAAVEADAEFMAFIVTINSQANQYAEDFTKLKDQVRYGKGGAVTGPLPTAPSAITPPDSVDPNVEARFRAMAQRIKAHPAYTTGIGESLGIEAEQSTFDPLTAKPELKVRMTGGQPEVVWKKNKMSAIEIHACIAPATTYSLLAIDTTPNYIDTTPPPPQGESQLRKYKAIYRLRDSRVGQWSDEVSVTVGG
jgi:hypothetical protein